jgi:hypothetical protein
VNTITRTTRACTFEALNDRLKAAIRAHGVKFGPGDSTSDVMMCCETVSVIRKAGLFNSTKTTLSAVYITPQWLVWAESTDKRDASAGSARLTNIDVRDYQDTAGNASMPDEGLNITGRYTDKNRTGITFIGLDTNIDGQKYRQALEQTINKTGR